ncbi:hypothetical protein KI387_040150, partial [Taxus chinensis]
TPVNIGDEEEPQEEELKHDTKELKDKEIDSGVVDTDIGEDKGEPSCTPPDTQT